MTLVAELPSEAAVTTVSLQNERSVAMSYEEFLTSVNENTHAEWVNGETLLFMPPGTKHQQIVAFLLKLLGIFVDHFQLGEVITAPYEMKVTPDSNSREPDLLFIAQEHLDRLTENRLIGPADLIVEVISPESVYRDRSDKFDEYEAAGVREYWTIDARPGKERVDFWVLDTGGRYRAALPDEKGVYHAAVIAGFKLKMAWLWASEKPSPLLAFAEMAGFSPEIIEILRRGPQG
jgi:Uma2 family endonuclease